MTSFGDRPGIMELESDDENSKTMDYTKVSERLDSNENQEKDTALTGGGDDSGNHPGMDLLCGAMRGRNPQNPSDRTKELPTEQRLEINQSGKTNCLTTVQKDNLLISCLTSKRSEYGKQIRKQYEAGGVKAPRKEIQQLEPRTDGKTNTLTTVQKDNLLIQLGRGNNKGGFFDHKSPTLISCSWQNNNFLMEGKDVNSRIKGITIKENGIRPHQGDDKKSGISELGTVLFEEAKTGTLTTVHQPLFFEEQREQRNIRDIHTKAKTLLATSYKGAQSNGMTLVAAPIQLNPSKESNNNQPYQQNRVYSEKGTSPACMVNMSCGSYAILKKCRIRRLTPTECARLQTIPEWYKWGCSNTQQYKMLGNGWTVEVIKHIFSFLPDNLKQQE